MPLRTAKVVQEYAGREIKVGERFDVEDKDVVLLLLLDRIEPEEGEAGYTEREMSAGEPAGYRTRDMQPENRKPGRPRKGT